MSLCQWKVPGSEPPVYLSPWQWIKQFLKTFSSPE